MQHRKHYTNPREQSLIILIILMVPIFAVNSFVGVWCIYDSKFTGVAIETEYVDTVLDALKECWEAVSIWAFLRLMYAYSGVDLLAERVPDELKGKKLHQMPPFNFIMSDPTFDTATAKRMVRWTQQFIVARPILSIVTLVAQMHDVYDDIRVWLPISIAANIR